MGTLCGAYGVTVGATGTPLSRDSCTGNVCSCSIGFSGIYCLDDNQCQCASSPCNAAFTLTCNDNGLSTDPGYECICDSLHMGTTCNEEIDACTPNPCENGGACNSETIGEFMCTCTDGWTGQTCTDDVPECDGK